MSQEDRSERRWREAFTAILKDTPTDYSRRHEQMTAIRQSFYRQLAIALAQPLRDYLVSLPQETYEQKSHLARWLNEQLNSVGLAVLCHRTYRPATLIAESDSTGKGYYALEVHDESSHHIRTLSKRRSLPFIELVQDDPNAAPPLSARVTKGRGTHNQR